MKRQLTLGGHCFVLRPETSFSGNVAAMRDGWVRVIGKGSIQDTYFDEWFPIKSHSLNVEAS